MEPKNYMGDDFARRRRFTRSRSTTSRAASPSSARRMNPCSRSSDACPRVGSTTARFAPTRAWNSCKSSAEVHRAHGQVRRAAHQRQRHQGVQVFVRPKVSVSSPSRLVASLATHLDALYPLASASHRASHASHRASRARSRIATMFAQRAPRPRARASRPSARARATPRRHRGRHPRAVAETPPAPRALSIEELSARPRANARGAVRRRRRVGEDADERATRERGRERERDAANAELGDDGERGDRAGALAVGRGIKYVFDTPSRTYVDGANTVGRSTTRGRRRGFWNIIGANTFIWDGTGRGAAKRGAGTLLGSKVKDFIRGKV